MHNKKLIRFAESFILLPIMSISVPALGSFIKPYASTSQIPQIVSAQNQYLEDSGSIAILDQVMQQKEATLDTEGKAIDAYFTAYQMPLAGLGRKMAEEAQKNGLDWRLIPSIAVRESSGNKHPCTNVGHNFFGWGSCAVGFDSDEQAIEVIAKNLGGNDPQTAYYYKGKGTEEILETYNPPSVAPGYVKQVFAIMDDIKGKQTSVTPDARVSFYAPSAQIE